MHYAGTALGEAHPSLLGLVACRVGHSTGGKCARLRPGRPRSASRAPAQRVLRQLARPVGQRERRRRYRTRAPRASRPGVFLSPGCGRRRSNKCARVEKDPAEWKDPAAGGRASVARRLARPAGNWQPDCASAGGAQCHAGVSSLQAASRIAARRHHGRGVKKGMNNQMTNETCHARNVEC